MLLAEDQEISTLVDEITTLRKLDNADNLYCIRLHYLYEDDKNLYLVTNLLKGPTLLDHFNKSYADYSEYDCLETIISVIKGLAY